MRAVLMLAAFVVIVAAAASFGAMYMPGAWYAGLAKPAWTPPNWLFAPVWTVLYLFIAVAGWLAWRAAGWGSLLGIWLLQLVLNASWSWWMFGQHKIFAALLVITGMWLLIVAFIGGAWRVSRPAALLFLPYLAWVSYAGALNFAVWRLNG